MPKSGDAEHECLVRVESVPDRKRPVYRVSESPSAEEMGLRTTFETFEETNVLLTVKLDIPGPQADEVLVYAPGAGRIIGSATPKIFEAVRRALTTARIHATEKAERELGRTDVEDVPRIAVEAEAGNPDEERSSPPDRTRSLFDRVNDKTMAIKRKYDDSVGLKIAVTSVGYLRKEVLKLLLQAEEGYYAMRVIAGVKVLVKPELVIEGPVRNTDVRRRGQGSEGFTV
ncbi:hypothetical protein [Saccharothrix xinjiangensis]|uniref:Uncharacterized protein n=1 Tax=Saccharothrix xinjiangensis TaxID=204798 RepID=A0ABV9XTZ4_9PSEU